VVTSQGGTNSEREFTDVSVILVRYNTASLLDRCPARLERAALGLRTEVLIVDNASRWLRGAVAARLSSLRARCERHQRRASHARQSSPRHGPGALHPSTQCR